MRDLRNNTMRFLRQPQLEGEATETIQLEEIAHEVTCMAQSNNQNYLAVGMVRQGCKGAYVVIHHIKNCGIRTRVQIKIDLFQDQAEPTQQRFVTSISFLPDDKYVAVALNGPDTKIMILRWSVKSSSGRQYKVIAEQDFSKMDVSKISIHPLDRTLMTTSGKGLLR